MGREKSGLVHRQLMVQNVKRIGFVTEPLLVQKEGHLEGLSKRAKENLSNGIRRKRYLYWVQRNSP